MLGFASSPQPTTDAWIADCHAVTRRAEQTLEWAGQGNLSLLTIALDHLTLARAGLYRALLSAADTHGTKSHREGEAPSAKSRLEGGGPRKGGAFGAKSRQDAGGPSGPPPGTASFQVALSSAALSPAERAAIETHLTAAVAGLREAGNIDMLPLGLLTRAMYRALMGDEAEAQDETKGEAKDEEGARADLDEAWRIAQGGDMALFEIDILLARARLFFRGEPEEARRALDEAASLIKEHGYHRRDGELADARALLR